jgi:hypothetical protein
VLKVDTITAISLLILCMLLGVSGQLVRIIVELKKEGDSHETKEQKEIDTEERKIVAEMKGDDPEKQKKLENDLYDTLRERHKSYHQLDDIKKSITISLIVGIVIGAAAVLYKSSQGSTTIDTTLMASIMATGYAGSDAMEGIIDSVNTFIDMRKMRAKQKKIVSGNQAVPPSTH